MKSSSPTLAVSFRRTSPKVGESSSATPVKRSLTSAIRNRRRPQGWIDNGHPTATDRLQDDEVVELPMQDRGPAELHELVQLGTHSAALEAELFGVVPKTRQGGAALGSAEPCAVVAERRRVAVERCNHRQAGDSALRPVGLEDQRDAHWWEVPRLARSFTGGLRRL